MLVRACVRDATQLACRTRVLTRHGSSMPYRTLPSLSRRSSPLLLHQQTLSTLPPPGSGISGRTMAAGMAFAAFTGIGIGLLLPTSWVTSGDGGGDGVDAAKSSHPSMDASREDSQVVHENVRDIAEDIPRPAIIVDATRAEVEARYEFHSCIASGGSATVWRATERATGHKVAIKVVDKKLLLDAFLNMEVASLVRCHGHPNITQLLAAYDIAADDVSPDGEWHLVMELAEGGELFERLLNHGAYTEKVTSQLLGQVRAHPPCSVWVLVAHLDRASTAPPTALRQRFDLALRLHPTASECPRLHSRAIPPVAGVQVARAIYHLHSCGICHRDIKPENVVLMSNDP